MPVSKAELMQKITKDVEALYPAIDFEEEKVVGFPRTNGRNGKRHTLFGFCRSDKQ